MSHVSRIEYDPHTQVVLCTDREALCNDVLLRRMYRTLYPNCRQPVVAYGYRCGDDDGVDEWLYKQKLYVLNDKHIAAINAVGVDAFRMSFVIVRRDMLFALVNHSGSVSVDGERVVLKQLLDKCGMTWKEYHRAASAAAQDSNRYRVDVRRVDKIADHDSEEEEESMGFDA